MNASRDKETSAERTTGDRRRPRSPVILNTTASIDCPSDMEVLEELKKSQDGHNRTKFFLESLEQVIADLKDMAEHEEWTEQIEDRVSVVKDTM